MNARFLSGAFAAAAFAAAVPCALAQGTMEQKKTDKPAAGMPMPKPATEMSALKFFDGSWSCEGNAPASPMGPAHKFTTKVKSHTDLGGFWQSGMVKSKSDMGDFEGMFHMTYDPVAKNYLMLWVDNMGGWSQTTSTGWDGDKIVFAGDSFMSGKKMGSRDTFVKKADGSMAHTGEMEMDGKWAAMMEETCKKAAEAHAHD